MRLRVITALCAAAGSCVAAAQTYPDKAVTVVAPFSAGGSVDLVARALAQQMSERWKQPVVVSNRPGASGNIGAEQVVRAAPDGYTLLMATTAMSSSPALFAKLPFDPVRDLAPVSLVVTMTNVLVVHPSLPVRSVGALLALAKSQPGTLDSASAGVGSSNHLALVMFNTLSGGGIGHVPYKGAAPAVNDVMGGHVAMTFAPIAAIVTQVRSRRLRALAVTAARRSSIFPELPTIAESGVAGYDASGWNAVFAPRAVPRDIVGRVHATVRDSIVSVKMKDVLLNSGAEGVGSTPEELAQFLGSEIAKWRKVVAAAGIKLH